MLICTHFLAVDVYTMMTFWQSTVISVAEGSETLAYRLIISHSTKRITDVVKTNVSDILL